MIPAFKNKMSVLLAPASQTAAATRSANVDCLGADYAVISLNLAAEVNTDAIGPTIVLKESDDTTATNFATWSSSCTITGANGDLAVAKAVRFFIDTKARKRYLNLAITTATHTTNDIITGSGDVTLSRQGQVAAGTAALVGSTNDTVVVL